MIGIVVIQLQIVSKIRYGLTLYRTYAQAYLRRLQHCNETILKSIRHRRMRPENGPVWATFITTVRRIIVPWSHAIFIRLPA